MRRVPEAHGGLRNLPREMRSRGATHARWALSLIVVLALVGAVAGCGGGGSSSSGAVTRTAKVQAPAKTAESASMKEFIVKATQICERGDRRKSERLEAAAGDKGLNVNQLEGEHLITAVVLPIYTEVNDELAALSMPKGHEAEIESIISGVRSGIVKSEAEPLLALQGKAFVAPDETVTELGVTGCIF